MLLAAARIEAPGDLLDVTPPCPEWLHRMTADLDLYICSSQDLDKFRRRFCDYQAVALFFERFHPLIEQRDPRLVFTMHEAQLSARRTFRGLIEGGHLPLLEAETKVPHITALCTVSAGGTVFRPLVIHKELLDLQSLAQFSHLASFASSSSGWITSDLFAMFAIDFCSQLSLYRLSLSSRIAQAPVLLILAGDLSRMNLMASVLFRVCKVDVLILPSNTTPALHPVQAVITPSLHREYKQELVNQLSSRFEHLTEREPVEVEVLRCAMVAAFLNAFRRETIPVKLSRAFEATGFVPFNPNHPHESLVPDSGAPVPFDGVLPRPSQVEAQLLTDPDSLAARFAAETGRPMTPEDATGLDIDSIWQALMEASLETGRALTPRPNLWMMDSDQEATLI
jgi:hypothetical protein